MLFDDIEVLLVLSKAKSLSQAAGQLYMSRPGLSQKIAAIEKQLGTSLINRTSTGISLTQAGKVAVKFAQSMADMERVMAAQIAAIDEHFPANITVGMSYADGVALLPRLVALYMRQSPEARVHLDAGYEPELVQKLKEGELDFAILENQPTEPGIVTEVLGYKKLVFLAPDKAPYNQTLGPVPIETLLKWPMIVYEWHSGRHMVGNRHFRERYGLSLRDQNMVGCFDTHEAMVEGVKAGLGWRRCRSASPAVTATSPASSASRRPPTPCGTPCPSPGPPATPRATRHARSPTSFARTSPRATSPTALRRSCAPNERILQSASGTDGLLRRRRTGERTPACPAGPYRPPFGIVIPRYPRLWDNGV
ncbi:MAG: LysR substrate-binding domain-containing protein [Senegalimassilia faecalis]